MGELDLTLWFYSTENRLKQFIRILHFSVHLQQVGDILAIKMKLTYLCSMLNFFFNSKFKIRLKTSKA